MNALFIIAAAILLLGPLIAIHEFGHYFVARKLGVKVLVYSIGFGPTVLKWTSKKSGINYQLSALPFGGYVKIRVVWYFLALHSKYRDIRRLSKVSFQTCRDVFIKWFLRGQDAGIRLFFALPNDR